MKIPLTIIFILISQIAFPQQKRINQWHIYQTIRDTSTEYYFMQIDTIKGDTAKYSRRSNRYVEINKEGVKIIDGHKMGGMGKVCGCEPLPHGYWIERYPNGRLKEQGQYHCRKKTGTWIYGYENGQIRKVENFNRPYIEMFTRQGEPWDTLRNNFLLEGPYLEYYPNGQLKTQGTYKILEEYTTTDTINTYDPETYERIPIVRRGEFWLPKSKKTGYWNHYSESGKLIKQEYFDTKTWKNDQLRGIESRYWDIIFEIVKLNEENKKE